MLERDKAPWKMFAHMEYNEPANCWPISRISGKKIPKLLSRACIQHQCDSTVDSDEQPFARKEPG